MVSTNTIKILQAKVSECGFGWKKEKACKGAYVACRAIQVNLAVT